LKLFHLLPKVNRDGNLVLTEARNIFGAIEIPKFQFRSRHQQKKNLRESGCHDDKLKQFVTTPMGRNLPTRTMRTWMEPHGPHNCGPSFADLPPEEVLKTADFSYDNTEKFATYCGSLYQ
jgi:hypothetical protein